MKEYIALGFVTLAACFFGWSLHGFLRHETSTVEIVVVGVEKGQTIRPSEVLLLQKRREWSI